MKLITYRNLQNILLIAVGVLTFTGTISGICQVRLRNRNVETFDTIKAISGVDCALYCKSMECKSFNYNSSDHSCQTIHIWKDLVIIVRSNEGDVPSFTVYEDDTWFKVYSFTTGSGVAVYNSFMGIGARSTWGLSEDCTTNSCPALFRSHLMDAWEHLPIDQVKLVIYQNENPAVIMTFNGTKSTKDNWFTLGRVLSSPWNDLTKTNVDIFTIKGTADRRRFYLLEGHYGCAEDSGWISVIENKEGCPWEARSELYPYILFSRQINATVWSKNYGVGDSMAIFIKMDSSRLAETVYSYFAK